MCDEHVIMIQTTVVAAMVGVLLYSLSPNPPKG